MSEPMESGGGRKRCGMLPYSSHLYQCSSRKDSYILWRVMILLGGGGGVFFVPTTITHTHGFHPRQLDILETWHSKYSALALLKSGLKSKLKILVVVAL